MSTCSNKGWEKFGRQYFKEVLEYFPDDIDIHGFYDKFTPDVEHERLYWHDIAELKRLEKFIKDNAGDPSKCGIFEQDGKPIRNYRFDSISYACVVYPLQPLSKMKEYDWVIRLDPDLEFKKKLPKEVLEEKLKDIYTAVYLGRKDWPHSETGFVAYNLRNDGDRFISRMVEMYDSGAIFALDGYTDCDVFDEVRKAFEKDGKKFDNISKDIPGMHPWPKTWLGEYTEHLKGPAAKDGVTGLNEMPTTALGQAIHTCAQFKPRTIIDVGVFDGSRAISMARASIWAQAKKAAPGGAVAVHLWALDPFGDEETKALDNYEKFSQEDERFTYTYINLKKEPNKWEPEQQVVHKILGRIELGKSDFAYVDGDHTVETLRRDLVKMCPFVKMVMSPTYFVPDDDGKCQDTTFFGANNIVEAIPHKVLPASQQCEDGGLVKTVIFGPAVTPGFGKVQTRNAVEDSVIHENIANSIKHDPMYIEEQIAKLKKKEKEFKDLREVPFIRQCSVHNLTALIVAGGPSVVDPKHKDYKKNWKKILEWDKREDVRMFVVKTTHDHMIYEKKVIPYGCILLDPRGHVKDFIGEPHPEVRYFVASMCAPSTWDVLLEKAPKLYGYNAAVKAGEIDYVLKKLRFKNSVFFGGGSSSATRGIGVMHGMGFRRFALAGWDQCWWDESKIDMEEKDPHGRPKYIKVNIQGRQFITQPILLAACQDFETSFKEHNDLEFEVLTDGMVRHVWDRIKREKLNFFEIYDK